MIGILKAKRLVREGVIGPADRFLRALSEDCLAFVEPALAGIPYRIACERAGWAFDGWAEGYALTIRFRHENGDIALFEADTVAQACAELARDQGIAVEPQTPQEVLLVTPDLAESLREHGELATENAFGAGVWGRIDPTPDLADDPAIRLIAGHRRPATPPTQALGRGLEALLG